MTRPSSSARPQRRPQRADPHRYHPLDLAFEPRFGKGGGRKSAYELLLVKEFQDALAGDYRAAKTMFKIVKLNHAERRKQQCPEAREFDEDMGYCQPRNAAPALLILELASPERVDFRSMRRSYGDQWVPSELLIEPWVAGAAQDRHGVRSRTPAQAQALARFTRDAAAAPVEVSELEGCRLYSCDVLPRDPRSTRYHRGRSGNPKGRPPAPKVTFELPFGGFLEQEIVIEIHGELRSISRLDALLERFQELALKGDQKIGRLYRQWAFDNQLRRCTEPPLVADIINMRLDYPVVPNPPPAPFRNPRSMYDCLVLLGAASARARTRVILEDWVVLAALERLGRRLTVTEQKLVMIAVRNPAKVCWPRWWEAADAYR